MAVLGRGAVSYQLRSPLHKMDCVSRYRDSTSCCAPRVFGGCETLPPRQNPGSYENRMALLPYLKTYRRAASGVIYSEHRGTSLMRNHPALGPYSRTWSQFHSQRIGVMRQGRSTPASCPWPITLLDQAHIEQPVHHHQLHVLVNYICSRPKYSPTVVLGRVLIGSL